MIRLLCLLYLLSPCAVLAQQPMPNRSAVVKTLVEQKYQALFDGTDDRRRTILGLLCADITPQDGDLWGMLIKHDRNPPFIPVDILVWQPTLEHVDVLTENGPAWIPHPPIPPQWAWLPCPSGPPPTPVPPLLPQPVGDVLAEVRAAKTIAEQARELAAEAVSEIKAHRAGVQNTWLKVTAIAGPILTAILTWLQMRGGSE